MLKFIWTLAIAGTLGCGTVKATAIPKPPSAEAWRAAAEIVPPVEPAIPEAEVQVDSGPEQPSFDRFKLDPKLLQEINLRADGQPLDQILLTLAKQAGANVTVDRDVQGATSVQFSHVPLIDAFENVVRPMGYALRAE